NLPDGAVVTWTVGGQPIAAGSDIVKGSTVDVVLSSGPRPRTVPNVAKTAFDAAKAKLEAERLVVERLDGAFRDDVKKGSVVSIDRAAGQVVPRDSTVKVTVSKGPDVVTMPDVTGRALSDAVTLIQQAGLTIGEVAGPDAGKVVAARPKGGDVVKR